MIIAQLVQPPARRIHVAWIVGFLKLSKLYPQFSGMARLYPSLAASAKESLKPFVPECFNHASIVVCKLTLCN
jgi:hypothetical protein